jgi:hypothetical protein
MDMALNRFPHHSVQTFLNSAQVRWHLVDLTLRIRHTHTVSEFEQPVDQLRQPIRDSLLRRRDRARKFLTPPRPTGTWPRAATIARICHALKKPVKKSNKSIDIRLLL